MQANRLILTITEAAALLRCGRSKFVQLYINPQKIPIVQLEDGALRVLFTDIEKYLQSKKIN